MLHCFCSFTFTLIVYFFLTNVFKKNVIKILQISFYTGFFIGIMKEVYDVISYQAPLLSCLKDISFNLIGLFIFIFVGIIITERSQEY